MYELGLGYSADQRAVSWDPVDPVLRRPRLLNRPHSITASAEIPQEGAEGLLLCQGTAAGGFSLCVKDGMLQYVHNYVGRKLFRVQADAPVTPGEHELRFEFEPTGEPDPAHGRGSPGRLQLYIDGGLVGNVEVPYTIPFVFNPGGMTCGGQPGLADRPGHHPPFPFSGTLRSVIVDVSGNLIRDDEAEMRLHLARE